jgi:branched-chain amino acid transport system permease protein
MVDIVGLISSTVIIFSLYSLLSLSLNLEYGYTGLPNFGKVAFQAVGAFVCGAFTAYAISFIVGSTASIFSPESVQIRIEFSKMNILPTVTIFIVSLIVACIISGLFGYAVSKPALKLREDYLALILLIFGEILRLIVRNYYPLVGGTHGLAAIPNPFSWSGEFVLPLYSVITIIVTLLVFIFLQRLLNSPYGRLLKAIRDNELASQVLGKESVRIKGQVLTLASSIAGLSGGLYAFYSSYVVADDFIPQKTFDAWLIVILGGAANNKGVLTGALVITLLDRSIQYLSGLARFPFEVNYLRYIIMGLIMIIILYYNPSGMIKEKPVKTPAAQVLKHE